MAGSLVQQYKQVGSAVPISLGYAVGKLINSLIQGETIKNYPNFKYSRYKNTSDEAWGKEFNNRKDRATKQYQQLELLC